MNWKNRCPIDKENRPIRHQAWHAGWDYRMQHGTLDTTDIEPIVRRAVDEYSPAVLSVWIEGYSSANDLKDERLKAE